MPIRIELQTDPEQPAIPLPEIPPGEHIMLPHRVDDTEELLTVRCLPNDFGGEVYTVNYTEEDSLSRIQPFNPENKKSDINTNSTFIQKVAVGAGKTALVKFIHYCTGVSGTPN